VVEKFTKRYNYMGLQNVIYVFSLVTFISAGNEALKIHYRDEFKCFLCVVTDAVI